MHVKDPSGSTPLHIAVEAGHTRSVRVYVLFPIVVLFVEAFA